jgi:hypothetical protein
VTGGPGLDAHVVRRGDEDPVYPDVGGVHGFSAGRGRRTWKPVDRRALDGSPPARDRREVRAPAGVQSRNPEDGVG